MFDAIILMAGQGKRMGLEENKVLYPIFGIPLYQFSLKAFLAVPECHHVILVIRPEDRLLLHHPTDSRIIVIEGGKERQDSVALGVLKCTEDIILVHDAARPNIRIDDIKRVYEATFIHKVALLASPVVDTIKQVEARTVQKTLSRGTLWAAQTPQGFNRTQYLECIEKAKKVHFNGSDDVVLFEEFSSIKPMIVEGNRSNIKVTTVSDLILIESYLKEGM
ncbi:MAG: 2-C-methyl-D-erythritol 4-phosphate cytidylyltransferase [Bacilli bacterium]|nr:2-C-methyl-D-erythritol 4-phosphate cytidylyltransferase [Bacilli bacterium]